MLVACLIWYDEPLDGLERCVLSLAGVADHLLAVDGAFADFPHSSPWSSELQHEVIRAAAQDARLPLELWAVERAWRDEVAKRSCSTEVGVALAGDDGWLLVIDGDEYVEEASAEVRLGLELIAEDVAFVRFRFGETEHGLPRLFRAQAGLTVRGAHWRYVVGDRVVCAHGNEPEEPCGDARELITLRHAPTRSDERQHGRSVFAQIRKTIEC